MLRVPTVLRYRGREGMLAWAFHRISGVGIFAFIVLHIIDIYLVGGNPELYDEVLEFYGSLPGRLMEVVLGGALLYHALNGLRIIILDLWPSLTVFHRAMWWAMWVIFIVLGVPGALIIMRPVWLPFVQDLGLL
jgi:succinate dehydrogenase / fumarate reductase, cytochrome b subunit